jgi:hypothetical protein
MLPGFSGKSVPFICQFQPVRNLFLLIAILLLAACTKEVEEESYISYKVQDGKEIRYTGNRVAITARGAGVFGIRSPLPGTARFSYRIHGISEEIFSDMNIFIEADSLRAGKYSLDNWSDGLKVSLGHHSSHYHTWPPAVKPFVVTISKHSNGVISGSFEGKLYNYVNTPLPIDSISVTGTINNVYLSYQ